MLPADPCPVSGGYLVERFDKKQKYPVHRVLIRLALLCAVVAVVLAYWWYAPVGDWSDPERLGALLDRLRGSPWAGPIVVLAFLLGSFIVVPVTAMIAATGIALGPTDGLLWASVASLIAASVNYALARMLPGDTIERWAGPWIGRMGRRFGRGGIVPVMVARNLPIAPFTLINVLAGGARIPFRDYIAGTILGMGPIIAALTLLGDRLRGAWEVPTATNIVFLILAILLWFVLALGLQSLSNRLVSAR